MSSVWMTQADGLAALLFRDWSVLVSSKGQNVVKTNAAASRGPQLSAPLVDNSAFRLAMVDRVLC